MTGEILFWFCLLGAVAILAASGSASWWTLPAFTALFFAVGALINGMTIGYLGYLMEISPNDKRPAYSAYFNALVSPAALLPVVGAIVADMLSLEAVFAIALLAAVLQLVLYARMSPWEAG